MFPSVVSRGDRGRETGRKGGGRCTGGGRRGGGKWDSQGGGKREKKGKITQHCTIFRNGKNAKGREPTNTGREPGLKGTGSGRLKPPCPPPPLASLSKSRLVGFPPSLFRYRRSIQPWTLTQTKKPHMFSYQYVLVQHKSCNDL